MQVFFIIFVKYCLIEEHTAGMSDCLIADIVKLIVYLMAVSRILILPRFVEIDIFKLCILVKVGSLFRILKCCTMISYTSSFASIVDIPSV